MNTLSIIIRRINRIKAAICAGVLIFIGLIAFTPPTHAAEHAVVVAYHRFGDDRYAATNTTLEQFDAHLAELASGGYTVLPLIDIARRIESGESLPDKTVAITIDDAFASVYAEAFPRLRGYGFPFTLFVATRAIDDGLADYASWDEIRAMQAAGVHIGSQTHSHPHLHQIPLDEVRDEIRLSNARFLAELGITPALHAYPYGEYSPEVRDIIKEAGFIAAFGQHSGVMHRTIHPFQYPRFAFNEAYGDINRFITAVGAVPIPVADITPESSVLGDNPPLSGFTILGDLAGLDRLNCFASGMGRVETIILGTRVEIRLPQPFSDNRGRINCTMPQIIDGTATGRWHWFGRQFVKP